MRYFNECLHIIYLIDNPSFDIEVSSQLVCNGEVELTNCKGWVVGECLDGDRVPTPPFFGDSGGVDP